MPNGLHPPASNGAHPPSREPDPKREWGAEIAPVNSATPRTPVPRRGGRAIACLTPASAALGLIFMAMPWLTISCLGRPVGHQTGFDIAIGNVQSAANADRTTDNEQAKRSKARAECEAIHSAIGIYKLETGDYPEQLLQLMEDGRNKKYLSGYSQVPTDPWGNDYVYNTDNIEQGEYVITSYGKDGWPGGTGDAADISHPASGEERGSNSDNTIERTATTEATDSASPFENGKQDLHPPTLIFGFAMLVALLCGGFAALSRDRLFAIVGTLGGTIASCALFVGIFVGFPVDTNLAEAKAQLTGGAATAGDDRSAPLTSPESSGLGSAFGEATSTMQRAVLDSIVVEREPPLWLALVSAIAAAMTGFLASVQLDPRPSRD